MNKTKKILCLVLALALFTGAARYVGIRIYTSDARAVSPIDWNTTFSGITRTLTQWIMAIGLTTTKGRIKNKTRITESDSPYTILSTDHKIFCDTDGGAITVLFPAGVDGTEYVVFNTGSSGNAVTMTPNGSELLYGANSNYIILDGGAESASYGTTEGWR